MCQRLWFLHRSDSYKPKICFKSSSTVETDLSDHHHLIYSMLKTTFKKEDPKRLIYRDYKNFNDEYFQNDLKNELSKYSKNYECICNCLR